MSFLEFLREVGKFARVGSMLAKESVSVLQAVLA
jgi:tyrosyl-tRNA synthetase